MTVLWLIFWLICDTPQVQRWNAWLVGLAVCFAIDLLALRRRGKL